MLPQARPLFNNFRAEAKMPLRGTQTKSVSGFIAVE
jgi:hypothetical protein